MRERFRGWYKPTDAEAQLLWERGTIALDANVLLAPYRISLKARNDLFAAVDAFKEQMWVPYQAGLEYQQNRLRVVAAQRAAYDEIRRELDSAAKRLQSRRADHPVLDPGEFRQVVTAAFDSVRRHVDRAEKGHPEVFRDDRDDDMVRDKWDELLADRVGEKLNVDDAWLREAEKRYAALRPPGFADQKKDAPARVYGDLILWCELLNFVSARADETKADAPMIFVTDDRKEDWWRIEQGQPLGPHPELAEEMAAKGGKPFWIYSVGRFVQIVAERMGWPQSSDVARELDEADTETATADHVDPIVGAETTPPTQPEHESDTAADTPTGP